MPPDLQPNLPLSDQPTPTDPTTTAAIAVAQASIQAAASVLGLTYPQVLAKLLEQAPPNPQQTNQSLP